jgi:hypothetical protein
MLASRQGKILIITYQVLLATTFESCPHYSVDRIAKTDVTRTYQSQRGLVLLTKRKDSQN